VAAGAVVTPNAVIPDGSVVMGVPARVVRNITESQIEENIKNAEEYVKLAEVYKNEKE